MYPGVEVKQRAGHGWEMTDERLANRLTDLKSATDRLREAVDEWRADGRPIIRDSVIKRFEFSFELAWKATRDWMRVWERDVEPNGPRQVLEVAFARGVVSDANRWSSMLFNRNLTVHIYSESEVDDIATWICANALEVLDELIDRLSRDG